MSPTRLFHDLELPLSADMHVHLRDGAMMETVTPLIEKGGVDCVFVMVSWFFPLMLLGWGDGGWGWDLMGVGGGVVFWMRWWMGWSGAVEDGVLSLEDVDGHGFAVAGY
jgi:hypothetical protein